MPAVLSDMTFFRSTAGWRGCAAAGLLLMLTACATTTGVAVRASSGSTGIQATGIPSSGVPTTGIPHSTPPQRTGDTAVPPPACTGTINRLTTPTGEPIITVTAGANFFVANFTVEPLSVAVYPDGTAISSLGVGTATEPLPRMTIGYIPPCTLDWATKEIEQLSQVKFGSPNVTDQGTTEVLYRPASGLPVKLRAYALGVADKHMTTGQDSRARLTTLLATLRAPLAGAATWTPDRLRVVEEPAPVASSGRALVWPSAAPLERVLTDRRFTKRCGVVGGADATAVLTALGDRFVYSRWTAGGRTTGLNVGALVPGQSGCGAG